MLNIKNMVKDKKVTFVRFENEELIYKTECGFEFPVPLADTKGAIFKANDKAMMFMRWIRKEIKTIETKEKSLIIN